MRIGVERVLRGGARQCVHPSIYLEEMDSYGVAGLSIVLILWQHTLHTHVCMYKLQHLSVCLLSHVDRISCKATNRGMYVLTSSAMEKIASTCSMGLEGMLTQTIF